MDTIIPSGISTPCHSFIGVSETPISQATSTATRPNGCGEPAAVPTAGRMTHYRATARNLPNLTDISPNNLRLGAPADLWFAVWLADYQVLTDPETGALAASWERTEPLRVRAAGRLAGLLDLLGTHTTPSPDTATDRTPASTGNPAATTQQNRTQHTSDQQNTTQPNEPEETP